MKILQRTDYEARRVVCPHCNSYLEYDKDDISYGRFGIAYVTCPVCGEEIDELDEEDMDITSDNIAFPQHFYRFGDGGVKLTDEETQKYTKEVFSKLEKSVKTWDYCCTGERDTIIIGFKQVDEIIIYVCKNYYEFDKTL